ncbi:hypothetical protein [Arthrospiribacter ruber]|uniref:Uncharacterized protein n=1 Tax=Arthrospiribacter ruber TaxID=2487934 RepID=A0A951IVV0_9BACT|nr:hypothetical protein [Arthrospiribacter ruber]MBW3466864.1 hypothetical protein [Arthrospiribacter ruber]
MSLAFGGFVCPPGRKIGLSDRGFDDVTLDLFKRDDSTDLVRGSASGTLHPACQGVRWSRKKIDV